MPVAPELLEILACPACRGELSLRGDRLRCASCRRSYPVRDDIPVLLIEEAILEGEGPGTPSPDDLGARAKE